MNRKLDLFLTFLKIGATTFGGGYAMISLIKEEVVEKKKWLDSDELLEIIAIAETTPGPIAINIATFVGYRNGKILGSIFATLGVVLPSLVIIYLISLFFTEFIENVYVAYAFVGIKAAVAFLILKAGFSMFQKMKKSIFPMIIMFIVIMLMIVFHIFAISFSTIYLILIGGLFGLIFYSIQHAITKSEKEEEVDDL